MIGESLLALLRLIAKRFTSEDTFEGTIIMVIAAMNAMSFQNIVKQCPREVSFLTHCFS